MQRKPNIKWRESDVEKLEKQIKRFNAKISRTKKAHPEMEDILPDKISKRDFMKNVTTRQDFNREMRSVDRFFKKGAADPITSKTGNTVTRWEKREIGIKVAAINRERKKERETYETDRPNMQMGTRKQNELKPKEYNFDKIRPGKEWDLFKEAVEKQVAANHRQEIIDNYKKNYLECIRNNLGEAGEELYDFVSRIPADKMYEIYWEDDEILKIQFTSDPLPASDISDITMDHWRDRLELEEGETYEDLDSGF